MRLELQVLKYTPLEPGMCKVSDSIVIEWNVIRGETLLEQRTQYGAEFMKNAVMLNYETRIWRIFRRTWTREVALYHVNNDNFQKAVKYAPDELKNIYNTTSEKCFESFVSDIDPNNTKEISGDFLC